MRLSATSAAVLAVVTLMPGVARSVPAQAATAAKLVSSLSPNRLGARSALTLSIGYWGGDLGVSAPITKTVMRLPAGMSLDLPSLRSCTAARLLANGADGCPPSSELGSGHALVETHVGSRIVTEKVALRMFLGPPKNLTPTFNILAQGFTPVAELLVFSGSVRRDEAPYGERLVMSIPPVASLPTEPDVSLVSLTMTVGPSARKMSHELASVRVPHSCPAGGFPFAAEFTYLEGAHNSALAKIPCPKSAPPAHTARTVSLNETGHLHLTSKHNFTLNEQGSTSGTVTGAIYVHLTAVSSSRVTAEVNIYAHDGSISGRGEAKYRRGATSASFSGSISIAHGTGSYANVHGSGLSFSGTIAESKNDAIVVHVSGKVSS